MEAGFLTALKLEELQQDRWKLLGPLVYAGVLLPGVVTVPAGFETDLESVPRWLPLVYGELYGTAHAAAVLHDYLYTTGSVDRRTADAVLYEAMRATGQPQWKSFVMWVGVRLGGWIAWTAHRAADAGRRAS